MKNLKIIFIFLIIFSSHFLSLALSYSFEYPKTANKNEPLNNTLEQSLGFYSKGELLNPNLIDNFGFGFIKLFPSRDRGYGSFELITVLRYVSQKIAQKFPNGERLQIGDMSAIHGGFISGHASHQNGLDVDLVYFRNNHKEQDVSIETGFIENFVYQNKISKNFDIKRNWELIVALYETRLVQRAFVDPVIKKTLCNYVKNKKIFDKETTKEALRILRPYPNHADHIHVRLYCPKYSTQCIPQEDPPAGDGCNEINNFKFNQEFI
jgi:penicillin-insensitive murein endopeptidase